MPMLRQVIVTVLRSGNRHEQPGTLCVLVVVSLPHFQLHGERTMPNK